jgi:uncharacterized protein YcbX
MIISRLYIHPIKSLAGIRVDAFSLTDRGPAHDRRWMLVGADGEFMTQRRHPRMVLLHTALEDGALVVCEQGDPHDSLRIPAVPEAGESLQVRIWDDVCTALHPFMNASAWFSRKLDMDVRLVYMPDSSHRAVDADYAPGGAITSFSDGYPLLLIGEASLDDLNVRLSVPVSMERFRPNIVIAGAEAYAEDGLVDFSIGDIRFSGVKRCARCVLTTIDPATAMGGKEPLRTLSGYRTVEGNVMFGMNLLHVGTGTVRVGDRLMI